MADPQVDLVIAVHTPRRPIGRAVRSVLDGSDDSVRVTVVCHNIDQARIVERIDAAHRDRVRFLELHDGLNSPAGPFNAGTAAATAPYVSIMGSDDQLEPGACASWLRLARSTGADAVITRLVLGQDRKRPVPTPPTRPLRSRRLDPVRDRLSYRSAPLGLVARSAIDRLDLRLDPDVPVGDDVPYVTRLWFEGRALAYDRTGPAYVIGEDAADRVTFQDRPVSVELAFVRRLVSAPWFRVYGDAERRAVVAKLIRIHLFGVVLNRTAEFWDEDERRALAAVARELLQAAPGAERAFSIADTRLLTAILASTTPPATLAALAQARRRHGTPATVLTPRLRDMLRREGPARLMAASGLSMLTGRWAG